MFIHSQSITGALCLGIALLNSSMGFALDKKPLSNQHIDLGLTCESCHGTGEKKPVTMEKCLSCHESYAAVAEKTKDLGPNPHDNHLAGLDCTKCHQGHKPQVVYCQTCHAGMEFRKK
jgi:fumarate reductase flavoprotein subunit